MLAWPWSVHPGLLSASRVPALIRWERGVPLLELAALVVIGGLAAGASLLPDLQLRIPGHAILRSVFPMAFGMALVPRRGGGCVMGASALGTALLLKGAGFAGFGVGALTSLGLTGPLLDLALVKARPGWRLYLGFLFAGLTANLVALFVRGGFKVFQLGSASGRPVDEWWQQAVVTYPVCGILAGLLSAVVWFQFRGRSQAEREGQA